MEDFASGRWEGEKESWRSERHDSMPSFFGFSSCLTSLPFDGAKESRASLIVERDDDARGGKVCVIIQRGTPTERRMYHTSISQQEEAYLSLKKSHVRLQTHTAAMSSGAPWSPPHSLVAVVIWKCFVAKQQLHRLLIPYFTLLPGSFNEHGPEAQIV